MNIFLGTTRKKQDCKLIGGYLPTTLHNYITLYALAKGVSKTDVIKEVLEAWVKTQLKSEHVDVYHLMEEIVDRSHEQWKVIRVKGEMSFKSYKEKLEAELRSRSIDELYIEKIIKGL